MKKPFFNTSSDNESPWWFIPEFYCPIMLELEKELNKRLSKDKGIYESELCKIIELLIEHQLNHFESLQIKNQSSFKATHKEAYEKKAEKFERDYDLLDKIDSRTILKHFKAYFTYVHPNLVESSQSDKSDKYLKFSAISRSIANYRVPYATARIIIERLTATQTANYKNSDSYSLSNEGWRYVCESEFYEAMHELIQDVLIPSTDDGNIKRSEEMAHDIELKRVYKERFDEGIKILQDAGLVKKEGVASYNHGYKRPTYTFVAKNLIKTVLLRPSASSQQDAQRIKDIKNAAIHYVEEKKLQRLNDKSSEIDWMQFLHDRINSFNLSAVKLEDVDRELSKAIYGKSYTLVEKKRIEIQNEKFILELNDINNLEISDADSIKNNLLHYKKLLNVKDYIIDANYAHALYSYAKFLILNHSTNAILEELNLDREKEILTASEQAIKLTESNHEKLKENTYYMLTYAQYLLKRNQEDVNYVLEWVKRILENLSDISDNIFNVDCLITIGRHFFWKKDYAQEAWDVISRAESIIMNELSIVENSIAARLVQIHDMKAQLASELFGHLDQSVINEYEAAIKYSAQLSSQDLKIRGCSLDSIFMRYESCLTKLSCTERLNQVYIQHLNTQIEEAKNHPEDRRYSPYLYSTLFEWASFLHLNDSLKQNFNDFNNILNRVADFGSKVIINEFYEELTLLQAIWDYPKYSDQSYRSQVKFADMLTNLATKQTYLLSDNRDLIPSIEKTYNEALFLYEKYSNIEMRCLINVIDIKLEIAQLYLSIYGEYNFDFVIAKYKELISFLDELESKSSYFRLLKLEVLNKFIYFFNSKCFDYDVIKGLIDEAIVLHNEIIPNIYIDFDGWSEIDILDFVLFKNSGYDKNEEDIEYYRNTVMEYDYFFQYHCEKEIVATYKNLIKFYEEAHWHEVIEDSQLDDALNNLIDKICESEDLSYINYEFELFRLCIEAFPDVREQVRARYNLKNTLIKTNSPQYFYSYLPRNIINEKLESINWKEEEDSYDAIFDWKDLAIIYESLGLHRKEKRAYLRILEILSKYQKTENIKYSDVENELDALKNLYRIYLKSCRYKIAITYLDKIINIYEKLRIGEKSFHKEVKQYKLERIALEDKMFE